MSPRTALIVNWWLSLVGVVGLALLFGLATNGLLRWVGVDAGVRSGTVVLVVMLAALIALSVVADVADRTLKSALDLDKS